jgi:hypothetical protein
LIEVNAQFQKYIGLAELFEWNTARGLSALRGCPTCARRSLGEEEAM